MKIKITKFEKNEVLGLIQLISFYRSTGKRSDSLSLKFGELRELWPWQSKYPDLPPYTSPFMSEPSLRWCLHWVFWRILIVKAYNSLNSGLIFKILVPKHISFPRPFIFICWTTMWHVPTWPETCPKVDPWKMKIRKVEKKELSKFRLANFR